VVVEAWWFKGGGGSKSRKFAVRGFSLRLLNTYCKEIVLWRVNPSCAESSFWKRKGGGHLARSGGDIAESLSVDQVVLESG
jgi:hypothetical protein